jgi:hypothetical protein
LEDAFAKRDFRRQFSLTWIKTSKDIIEDKNIVLCNSYGNPQATQWIAGQGENGDGTRSAWCLYHSRWCGYGEATDITLLDDCKTMDKPASPLKDCCTWYNLREFLAFTKENESGKNGWTTNEEDTWWLEKTYELRTSLKNDYQGGRLVLRGEIPDSKALIIRLLFYAI